MTQINKTLSAQEKGKLNASKLKDWLTSNPVVPIYHGQVNKTAICKMHGIPKSTIDTNQSLQEIFAPDGPIEALAAQQIKTSSKKPRSSVKADHKCPVDSNAELIEQIETLKGVLNSIRLDLASEEFLLATGRYIPRLYDHSRNE